ncbi:hypothetical protein TL16_g00552 [Triparma laevis f. inornata]|uniref:Protein kinase domain-containing protein n=1 Tax=Triparma laevis f. inornata TaxID=1714386 RepID=A0A9W7DPG7_9STRA|nr:hypothetical protein TL16_g00552 [Triparma laevis f. inornata]
MPVVGEICKTAQTVLDLIQQAGAVNSTIESVRETVARIDPVLERFQPPEVEGGEPIEVDPTILQNMEDLRKNVENISRHVRNWLKKGKVGKMFTSGKYSAKFTDDIKEMEKLLNSFSVAIGVDTNLAVRALTKSAEKRNRRESASKTRNGILFDLEIKVKDYDYKSDEPFAKGSTADVYLINYNGHEMVAKVFNLRMLNTVERVKKLREFKKELAIMRSCKHPNIIEVFGATTIEPERLTMVMEFIEGGSLREVLDKVPVLKGPGHPAPGPKSLNILITKDLRGKVTDFGLSKSELTLNTMTMTSMATTAGGFKGTPQWSAPEVLEEEGDFTEKADVYSFAVIMYEVLTGEKPWEVGGKAVTLASLVGKVMYKKERPSPMPQVNRRLTMLLERGWAQAPEDRPDFERIVDELKGEGEEPVGVWGELKGDGGGEGEGQGEGAKKRGSLERKQKELEEGKAEVERMKEVMRREQLERAESLRRKNAELEEEKRKTKEQVRKEFEEERKAEELRLQTEERRKTEEEEKRKKEAEEQQRRKAAEAKQAEAKRKALREAERRRKEAEEEEERKKAASVAASSGRKFGNEDLKVAAKEWCTDEQTAVTKYGPISGWNVSEVTSMRNLFSAGRSGPGEAAKQFNADISRWDVSNVPNMHMMFYGAESFNCDLSSWNVGKVESMRAMFHLAEAFDKNTIKGWQLRKGNDTWDMFGWGNRDKAYGYGTKKL